MLRFIIGNPKYLEGPEGRDGIGGFEPPPFGSNGCLAKIMSTSLGILVCTLTSSISLGIWGLDLKPTIVWVGVVRNGVLVIVTIQKGIATNIMVYILLIPL
jgi:hypothetical protein